jgi:hypothetical protein
MKQNVKANKKKDDWVVGMFCDYGTPGKKRLIRASYSLESSKHSWVRIHKMFSKNGFRCWQEDRNGKVINDTGAYHDIQESGQQNRSRRRTKKGLPTHAH